MMPFLFIVRFSVIEIFQTLHVFGIILKGPFLAQTVGSYNNDEINIYNNNMCTGDL